MSAEDNVFCPFCGLTQRPNLPYCAGCGAHERHSKALVFARDVADKRLAERDAALKERNERLWYPLGSTGPPIPLVQELLEVSPGRYQLMGKPVSYWLTMELDAKTFAAKIVELEGTVSAMRVVRDNLTATNKRLTEERDAALKGPTYQQNAYWKARAEEAEEALKSIKLAADEPLARVRAGDFRT